MRTILLVMAVMATCASTSFSVAAESVLPHRMAKAKKGEWVLTREVETGARDKFTVVEVAGEGDAAVVTLRHEKFDADGTPGETRDIDINVKEYADRMVEYEAKAKQISRERLVVKDRELTVYAATWDDEENAREVRVWISDEVPVGGFVKSWSSDPEFPASEIQDFGAE